MTEHELSQARKLKKHQEAMRDPVYAAAYEAAERRRKERERSEEILKNYAQNGFYRPPTQEEPKEKTAQEMRMNDILKHFS